MSLKIECDGATHVGMVRSNNEDTYLVKYIDDESRVLCMVIDGVGGYEGGEVAAEIAANTVFEYLNDNPDGSPIARLKGALNLANNRIVDRANAEPKYNGMGCVATAAIIDPETAVLSIVHIGDTRLYMYRNGQLVKLTHDHSLVGYREEMGMLTEAEAMSHPNRNLIERCLGTEYHQPDDPNYLEAANYAIAGDCQLLLCSDGLCDMITSQAMASVLSRQLPPLDTADALIDLANKAGGRDNVTVVIAQIQCPQVTECSPKTLPGADPADDTSVATGSCSASAEAMTRRGAADNGNLTADNTPIAPRRVIASALAEQDPVATEAADAVTTETTGPRPRSWWANPRNISMMVCAFIVGVVAGVGLATQIRTDRDEQAKAEAEATHQHQLRLLTDTIHTLQDSLQVLTGNIGDTVAAPSASNATVPPVAAPSARSAASQPIARRQGVQSASASGSGQGVPPVTAGRSAASTRNTAANSNAH